MGLSCRCQTLPKGSPGRPCDKCKARYKANDAKKKASAITLFSKNWVEAQHTAYVDDPDSPTTETEDFEGSEPEGSEQEEAGEEEEETEEGQGEEEKEEGKEEEKG
jgi:hypothetical protein